MEQVSYTNIPKTKTMSKETNPDTQTFPPTEAFASNAHIQSMQAYQEKHRKSIDDNEGFWAEAASELHWFKKWDTVLNDSNAPFYNCLLYTSPSPRDS